MRDEAPAMALSSLVGAAAITRGAPAEGERRSDARRRVEDRLSPNETRQPVRACRVAGAGHEGFDCSPLFLARARCPTRGKMAPILKDGSLLVLVPLSFSFPEVQLAGIT